jgi:hypothetical protein
MRFLANNWRAVAALLSIVAFAISGTASDPTPW